MTPELQAALDRLDHVERQARGWKLLVVVAILIAAASIALPILRPRSAITPASDRARYSVVEAESLQRCATRMARWRAEMECETRQHDPLRAR